MQVWPGQRKVRQTSAAILDLKKAVYLFKENVLLPPKYKLV